MADGELLERTDVGDIRQDFGKKERTSDASMALERRQTARRMVLAMRDGANFDVEDFLFAATLGRTDGYEDEKATLEQLAALEEGQLVGVFVAARELKVGRALEAIGIVDSEPLHMRVHTLEKGIDFHQDYNREMSAGIVFSAAFKRSARGGIGTPNYALHGTSEIVDTAKEAKPYPVEVLHSRGEPVGHRRNDAFFAPALVRVGSLAVIAQISEADAIGQEMAARFMDTTFQRIDAWQLANTFAVQEVEASLGIGR